MDTDLIRFAEFRIAGFHCNVTVINFSIRRFPGFREVHAPNHLDHRSVAIFHNDLRSGKLFQTVRAVNRRNSKVEVQLMTTVQIHVRNDIQIIDQLVIHNPFNSIHCGGSHRTERRTEGEIVRTVLVVRIGRSPIETEFFFVIDRNFKNLGFDQHQGCFNVNFTNQQIKFLQIFAGIGDGKFVCTRIINHRRTFIKGNTTIHKEFSQFFVRYSTTLFRVCLGNGIFHRINCGNIPTVVTFTTAFFSFSLITRGNGVINRVSHGDFSRFVIVDPETVKHKRFIGLPGDTGFSAKIVQNHTHRHIVEFKCKRNISSGGTGNSAFQEVHTHMTGICFTDFFADGINCIFNRVILKCNRDLQCIQFIHQRIVAFTLRSGSNTVIAGRDGIGPQPNRFRIAAEEFIVSTQFRVEIKFLINLVEQSNCLCVAGIFNKDLLANVTCLRVLTFAVQIIRFCIKGVDHAHAIRIVRINGSRIGLNTELVCADDFFTSSTQAGNLNRKALIFRSDDFIKRGGIAGGIFIQRRKIVQIFCIFSKFFCIIGFLSRSSRNAFLGSFFIKFFGFLELCFGCKNTKISTTFFKISLTFFKVQNHGPVSLERDLLRFQFFFNFFEFAKGLFEINRFAVFHFCHTFDLCDGIADFIKFP